MRPAPDFCGTASGSSNPASPSALLIVVSQIGVEHSTELGYRHARPVDRVRKALFELGRVILAQQINPLTQKTPTGEAEHCLSNYRGSLQFWGAVQCEVFLYVG